MTIESLKSIQTALAVAKIVKPARPLVKREDRKQTEESWDRKIKEIEKMVGRK